MHKILRASFVLAAFIAAWWLLSIVADSILLPNPQQTVAALFKRVIASNGLYNVWVTLYRVFIGTLIGALFGTILGIIPRYSKLAEAVVRVVLYPLLQTVPTICWALMFILWIGSSDTASSLTVAVAVAPFFIINVWEGMKELDANLIEMASSYTHHPIKILGKVVMPMLYPYLFVATKSGFMIAWKIIVPAEMFGGHSAGMGYMLHYAYTHYRMADVFGWTLAFAFILIFFDYVVFKFVERKFVRKWKPQELKRL